LIYKTNLEAVNMQLSLHLMALIALPCPGTSPKRFNDLLSTFPLNIFFLFTSFKKS